MLPAQSEPSGVKPEPRLLLIPVEDRGDMDCLFGQRPLYACPLERYTVRAQGVLCDPACVRIAISIGLTLGGDDTLLVPAPTDIP